MVQLPDYALAVSGMQCVITLQTIMAIAFLWSFQLSQWVSVERVLAAVERVPCCLSMYSKTMYCCTQVNI